MAAECYDVPVILFLSTVVIVLLLGLKFPSLADWPVREPPLASEILQKASSSLETASDLLHWTILSPPVCNMTCTS